jgi:uridine kinase
MAYLIGITGGSASGKTTFINRLKEYFKADELAVLSQDNYYKPLHEQKRDDNGMVNFDLPESIDFIRFCRDIDTLESGKPLLVREYTFNNPGVEAEFITINPARVILVEGLFIFENKAMSNKLQLKLFIDAAEDIKYNRRLRRDSDERGLKKEAIQYQWHNHVKPSYDKFLLPYKDLVDMVILNNTHFENSLKVIVDHVRGVMN